MRAARMEVILAALTLAAAACAQPIPPPVTLRAPPGTCIAAVQWEDEDSLAVTAVTLYYGACEGGYRVYDSDGDLRFRSSNLPAWTGEGSTFSWGSTFADFDGPVTLHSSAGALLTTGAAADQAAPPEPPLESPFTSGWLGGPRE